MPVPSTAVKVVRPRGGRRLAASLALALAFSSTALLAAPAQAVTGTVTGVVKAIIGSAAPAAYQDAQIVLDRDNGDAASDNAAYVAQSAANGSFTLSGVTDGTYNVRIYPRGAAQENLAYEYYDNKWSYYGGTQVTVAGNTVKLNEVVLEQRGWVSGTVRDEAGKPVPGFRVSLSDHPMAGGWSAVTQADGTYTTRGAEWADNAFPGTYRATASGGYDGPLYAEQTAAVAIKANQTVTQDFVLKRVKTVTATVLHSDGTPATWARVGLRIKNEETGEFEFPQYGPITTDGEGKFDFHAGRVFKAEFYPEEGHAGPDVPQWWGGPGSEGVYSVEEAAVIDFPDSAPVDRTFTVVLGAKPVTPTPTPEPTPTPTPTPEPTPTPTPVVVGKVTVSGTAKVGRTLRATAAAGSPSDARLSYQWLSNGSALSGATSRTLVVPANQAGKKLTVRVTASAAGHLDTTVTAATSPAAVGKGTLKTSKPKITGKVKVGSKVRVKVTGWGPKPVRTSVRWYRNGVSIKGATSTTYRLKAKDRGKRITVTVTGRKTGFATEARTSSRTAKVKR